MKVNDPERYKATKSLLEKNKKLKKQVLKRQIGGGIKSVATMAKLMGSIPMLIVDPKSGFTMLATTVGDLKDMAANEPYYGHMTRKQIRSRRGRVAATLLVGSPVVAATNARRQLNQFEKDRKKIRKNEEILANLREGEVLKGAILKQTALISAQRRLESKGLSEEDRNKLDEKYNKALKDSIEAALNSVLGGRNIEGAVKDYMKRNGVTKLQASDIERLLKDFNLNNIEKQISKLTGKEQREINRLQSQLDELKERLRSSAEGVALSEEEIKQIKADINDMEKEKLKHTNKIDIIKEVGKKASQCQGLKDYMLYKNDLQSIVNDYIEKKNNNKEEIGQDDIDEMVAIFEQRIQNKENSYTSKERIEKEFENKELDRKKATGAILESFIEKPEKDKSNNNDNNSAEDNMYIQLQGMAEMVKELYVLDQKNNRMYGNSGIKAQKFIKEIKFSKPKNKNKK